MIEDKIKYNDYWERVQEKDKEIERLNNIIKEAREYIEEHTTYENYGYIDELQLINLDFDIKELKRILDKENI